MEFKKYPKLRRRGYAEVRGIEDGLCYIFPKLDGTNASVWCDENGEIKAGSRNRELSRDKDNAGFFDFVNSNEEIKSFMLKHPEFRLYGEWLVPHTFKEYIDEAWRKFYIFDVIDGEGNFLKYEDYKEKLEEFNLDYVPIISIVENPDNQDIDKALSESTYLTKDSIVGEGIVIKNYDFVNAFGDTTWAKVISSTFAKKSTAKKQTSATLNTEEEIIDRYCAEDLIEKEYNKILNLNNGDWSQRDIPRLLGIIWHEFLTEELPHAIKKMKHPIIDFKKLQYELNIKVKKVKSELF